MGLTEEVKFCRAFVEHLLERVLYRVSKSWEKISVMLAYQICGQRHSSSPTEVQNLAHHFFRSSNKHDQVFKCTATVFHSRMCADMTFVSGSTLAASLALCFPFQRFLVCHRCPSRKVKTAA